MGTAHFDDRADRSALERLGAMRVQMRQKRSDRHIDGLVDDTAHLSVEADRRVSSAIRLTGRNALQVRQNASDRHIFRHAYVATSKNEQAGTTVGRPVENRKFAEL